MESGRRKIYFLKQPSVEKTSTVRADEVIPIHHNDELPSIFTMSPENKSLKNVSG